MGASLRLSFELETELILKDAEPTGFEVAAADKIFHPAKALIEDNTMIVSSPSVPKPVAVRYAWHNNPAVSLYNKAGLPAPPFRSDQWSGPQGQSTAEGEFPE